MNVEVTCTTTQHQPMGSNGAGAAAAQKNTWAVVGKPVPLAAVIAVRRRGRDQRDMQPNRAVLTGASASLPRNVKNNISIVMGSQPLAMGPVQHRNLTG